MPQAQSFIAIFSRTLGSSVAGLLLTVVYSVLSARMLGSEGRGVLAAIQLWPTVLAGSMTLGMSASFVYHARKQRHLAGQLFATGLIVTIITSSVAGVLGAWILQHVLQTLSTEQIDFARGYLAVMLPATAITIYIGGCVQLIENLHLFNALKIVPVILQVAAILFLSITVGLTPERLAIATVVTQLLTIAWMIKTSTKEFGFSLRNAWCDISLLISFGLSVWAAEALGVLTQQIDKIWVSGALTLRDLGLYTLAFGMSRIVANIQNSAAAILFPRNVGKPLADVVESTASVFRITFWTTLVVSLPAAVLSMPLFPLVFGKDFVLTGHIFPVLVLECIFGTSSWVLAQAFNSLGKPHLIVLRQVSGLLSTVALAFTLVPMLGIWGVVLAVLAGAMVRLIVTLLGFEKGLGVKIPRLLINKNDMEQITNALKNRLAT